MRESQRVGRGIQGAVQQGQKCCLESEELLLCGRDSIVSLFTLESQSPTHSLFLHLVHFRPTDGATVTACGIGGPA